MQITNLLAICVVLFFAFLIAVIFASMVYFAKLVDEADEIYGPGEIDNTPYPDDEDNVIFRS